MKEHFKYNFDDLFNPALKAIHNLGESCSVIEMENEVIKIMKLSDEEINEIYKGGITKLNYRLAWARNYLKRYGLIENSDRGIWRLTSRGKNVFEVDQNEVYSKVKSSDKGKRISEINVEQKSENLENKTNEIESIEWKEKLLLILKKLDPIKFEKLCKLLLRELGFINVEITKQSIDGGIDGTGSIKVAEVMSFYLVFQCKRFKGVVPSSAIRDFRGAFIGRADKGLFISTGTFSSEAKKESRRDGAPPIDLIDGLEFCDLLKKSQLGIKTELVQKVNINERWYEEI